VQCGVAGGAEEIDQSQVDDQAAGPGEVTLHVAGETAAVGGVDLAFDGDHHRSGRRAGRRERRVVMGFRPIERAGIGAEHPAGAEFGHGGLLSRTV